MTHLFPVIAVSDDVGVNKPDRKPFLEVFKQLDIDPSEASSVVMIGNRVERDIKGANNFGITSIWCCLSKKDLTAPSSKMETPDYQFKCYSELLDIIGKIESK